MKCPKCNTEMRMASKGYVMKGDKLFKKIAYFCRNKNCPDFNKEVKDDYIPLDLEVEESE